MPWLPRPFQPYAKRERRLCSNSKQWMPLIPGSACRRPVGKRVKMDDAYEYLAKGNAQLLAQLGLRFENGPIDWTKVR